MGYELRRWLADRLPTGLSSGERLVALEIADQAHEKTRRAYGRSVLEAVIRRTGYANEKQLGKVLGKLGANGIELRVPLRDKEGEIVFSYHLIRRFSLRALPRFTCISADRPWR